MSDIEREKISMASRECYRITVRGRLDDRWMDWFNGSIQKIEQVAQDTPHTIMTCQVRDQSELLGILNRLSSLNLPLLEVKWIPPEEVVKRC